MWEYTDEVRDHYLHPRNVGEIENPDGFGEVGNIKCGDALRLTFTLDENKKINDAKFKTFGCGSAIASSSVLTEMVKGLSLEEAEKITNDDIAKTLGGLPDAKMHCSVMGQDALKSAIEYYRNGKKPFVKEVKSRLICTCFNVYENDIIEKIRLNGLTSVEQVTNYTKACGGCGKCGEEISGIIKKTLAQMDEEHNHETEKPKLSKDANKKLTVFEKIEKVRKVLNETVRPGLQNDGGDCEFVDIDGNEITVKLLGHCTSCPFSQATAKEFIEKELQENAFENAIVTLG
ncbi:MAG: Fe-S cluster assembly protein NifU [Chitinispirillales bacterium]|jgi:NifU-like protein|nr:Fe-S cluster assembly protein NifU [Chitinispirillales bacterium]